MIHGVWGGGSHATGWQGPLIWRTAFATEPAERFAGFGRPVLAPVAGTVLETHDGEPDHEARRSPCNAGPSASNLAISSAPASRSARAVTPATAPSRTSTSR